MSSAVARRYARAFFELSRERGTVSEVLEELRRFAALHESSDDFRTLEINPALHDADRRAVVQALGQKLDASETATNMVSMLAERQRLSILPDLVRLFEEMADEHLGIIRATVHSARQLTQSYRGELERKLEQSTGKKVLVSYQEDPNLIGGLVTEIGDRVIDGSIRGRINQLAESLRQN